MRLEPQKISDIAPSRDAVQRLPSGEDVPRKHYLPCLHWLIVEASPASQAFRGLIRCSNPRQSL
jgi:hypothetical protein